MRYFFLFVVTIISSQLIYAQSPRLQTYSADLLIIATKGGENTQWQNKDILVTLNYKTGDFKAIINNNDFYNRETNVKVDEENISENSEFIFIGNMPINKLINQKKINHSYDIELELSNNNISLSETLNFKMNVMRPTQGANNYRVFTLSGILYNDELNLPAFKGYNNEVEIRIIFNIYWSGE